MKLAHCLLPIIVLLFTAGLGAQQPGPQLAATLHKLDEASARFTSAEARVHKVFYNSIIRADDDIQDGTIYFRRVGSATEMGLRTTGSGARTVEYRNGTVKVYNPAIKCYDAVTKPGIETYLTLGFGGSGEALAKAWNIVDLGNETIDGVAVEKLDLTPKDATVKANVAKFSLWIDLARGVSLKQVLLSPSNDRQTATYSNIVVGKPIDTKPYKIEGKPCGAK